MDNIESPQLKDLIARAREVSLWQITGPVHSWKVSLNSELISLADAFARWDALIQARSELQKAAKND